MIELQIVDDKARDISTHTQPAIRPVRRLQLPDSGLVASEFWQASVSMAKTHTQIGYHYPLFAEIN